MRVLLVALLLVPWAGCVELVKPDATSTSQPNPTTSSQPIPTSSSAAASACDSGTGELFVWAQHLPGFTTPEYEFMYGSLDREHDAFYVRANETSEYSASTGAGTGRILPVAGALHNITAAEVRTEMQRMGVWRADRDYRVSVAWHDRASRPDVAALCEIVLDKFYGYNSTYYYAGVADCDGFTFKVDSSRGVHSSYSYCKSGPQEVRKAWDQLMTKSKNRVGASEP